MAGASGKLIINLQAVCENYRAICARLKPGCRSAAAVKANAYGLGAVEVAGALIEEGCREFFVANIEEAMQLRAAYPEIEIMILNGFYKSCADLYEAQRLTPVLGSFMEIKGYSDLARRLGKKLPVFLKFNTRMNRLGLGAVEAEELFAHMEMLEALDVRCVMSHLACADEPEHPMNKIQLEVFQNIAAHFPRAEKSFSNSSGVFLGPEYHFDMVRPGAALYGLNPTPGKPNPMRAVVSLNVPVIRTRIVYAGATVGYSDTYRFEIDAPLATVAAGYADGISWALGNRGALYWEGYRCPIRGRVSMDLTTVDLSAVPKEERPRPGDFLEILGEHQSADELAADAGTIGYEIITTLGNRYERHYLHAPAETPKSAV